MTRYEPDFLLFASEADILALWGGVFLLLALVALLMEQRRMKRAALNRIGWMPWTGIFMASALVGGGLLAVALPVVIKN